MILFVSTKRRALLITHNYSWVFTLSLYRHITGYSTHFQTLSRYSLSTICTQVSIRPGKQRVVKIVETTWGNNSVKGIHQLKAHAQ